MSSKHQTRIKNEEEFLKTLKGAHESGVRIAWPSFPNHRCITVSDMDGFSICYIPYRDGLNLHEGIEDVTVARRIAQAIAKALNHMIGDLQ